MRAWGTGLGVRLGADLTAFAHLHIALDGTSRGVRVAVAGGPRRGELARWWV